MIEQRTRPLSQRKPRSLLFPLDELHRRAGRSLPAVRAIDASLLPDPYRTLLVHERDMTRTLEQFHGCPVHLDVLSREVDRSGYWREVVLRLDGSERAVEFGAIRIRLERFPEPVRSQIVEERRPLGAILNAGGIAYSSCPTAYLEVEADPFLAEIFELFGAPRLFGRCNTLRDGGGRELAEIVEILPP